MGALLVIATTSAYFGNDWRVQHAAADSSLATAKKAAQAAEKANKELSSILVADAAPINIQDASTALMLDIYNRRLPNGVTIASITPGKFAASGSMSPLDALMEDVPGTKVKSLRINIRGTYSNYLNLLDYISDMQVHPVSIVRLKVQDQGFELGLRVYGNLS